MGDYQKFLQMIEKQLQKAQFDRISPDDLEVSRKKKGITYSEAKKLIKQKLIHISDNTLSDKHAEISAQAEIDRIKRKMTLFEKSPRKKKLPVLRKNALPMYKLKSLRSLPSLRRLKTPKSFIRKLTRGRTRGQTRTRQRNKKRRQGNRRSVRLSTNIRTV